MPRAKSVLLVDDQPEALWLVRMDLERAGYEVHVAESGRKALELQQQHAADVLVTDIFMPEMDGIETIDRIKAQYPDTRIIAMSAGWGRLDYLAIARQVGADAALAKPFTADELLRILRTVLWKAGLETPER